MKIIIAKYYNIISNYPGGLSEAPATLFCAIKGYSITHNHNPCQVKWQLKMTVARTSIKSCGWHTFGLKKWVLLDLKYCICICKNCKSTGILWPAIKAKCSQPDLTLQHWAWHPASPRWWGCRARAARPTWGWGWSSKDLWRTSLGLRRRAVSRARRCCWVKVFRMGNLVGGCHRAWTVHCCALLYVHSSLFREKCSFCRGGDTGTAGIRFQGETSTIHLSLLNVQVNT